MTLALTLCGIIIKRLGNAISGVLIRCFKKKKKIRTINFAAGLDWKVDVDVYTIQERRICNAKS